MHLNVVKGFTLAQIVVIGSGKQASSVTPNDGLKVTAMNVKGKSFEAVHFEWIRSDLKKEEGKGIHEQKPPSMQTTQADFAPLVKKREVRYRLIIKIKLNYPNLKSFPQS